MKPRRIHVTDAEAARKARNGTGGYDIHIEKPNPFYPTSHSSATSAADEHRAPASATPPSVDAGAPPTSIADATMRIDLLHLKVALLERDNEELVRENKRLRSELKGMTP